MSKGKGEAVMGGMRWLAIGKLVSMAISFVTTAVLARLLTPYDFGVMAVVLLVIALSNAIFEGAFGMGVTIKKDIDEGYIATTFWLSVILSAILVGVLWVISPWLEGFFHMPHLAAIIRFTSTSLIFNAASNVSYSLMRRSGQFRTIAIYQVGCSLIGYGPVSIGLALMGYGVWALAVGQVAVAVLTSVAALVLAKMPYHRFIQRQHIGHVFATSGFLTVSQILNWAALTGSNSVVGRMLGATQLGLYSRGWKLLDLVTTVSAQPMSEVLFPAFARMQDDPERARKALERALAVAVPFFATIAALTIAQSQFIVWVSLGPKWADTAVIMSILFLALVPRCCYKVSESVTVAFQRSGSAALRQGLYAAAMIGFSALAAPHGPVWVAVGASAAVTIFYLSSLGYAMRLVGLSFLRVIEVHIRAAILAGIIFLIDRVVTAGILPLSFFVANIVGGAIGLGVAIALFLYLPGNLLGEALIDLRAQAIAKTAGIRNKLLRRFGRQGAD